MGSKVLKTLISLSLSLPPPLSSTHPQPITSITTLTRPNGLATDLGSCTEHPFILSFFFQDSSRYRGAGPWDPPTGLSRSSSVDPIKHHQTFYWQRICCLLPWKVGEGGVAMLKTRFGFSATSIHLWNRSGFTAPALEIMAELPTFKLFRLGLS